MCYHVNIKNKKLPIYPIIATILTNISVHNFIAYRRHNEKKYRAGEGDGNLGLTHGLNGIRNTAKNIIQDSLEEGGRKDYKIDCIAAEFKDWEVSW